MFTSRFKILRICGFPIYIDLSWFVIALLITWSLATGVFPKMHEESPLGTTTYWMMGFIGAIGLFVSILLHELGHSVVAQRFGMRIRGITLFIFGGVAELGDEPPNAKAEFLVAIAGPIVSVLIAVACTTVWLISTAVNLPTPIGDVTGYLGMINAILVAFNVIPAFPLDGGRMFRAFLWSLKDDLRWATRISSTVGALFGGALIALGVLNFLLGNFFGGIWWCLIGLFLRRAAQMSYQQLIIRRALEGEPVARFMTRDPISVPPDISIQQLVDDYAYRYYFKMYPVTSNGELVGCVSLKQIKDIARDQWPTHRVEEIAQQCTDDNVIDVSGDSMKALAKMNQTGASRLMVVDHGRLVGIVALKDLVSFLSTRIDLEELGTR